MTLTFGTPRISVQVWISFGILCGIAILGIMFAVPIQSIIPCAVAVGLVAWKHGIKTGTVFAVVASLVSVSVGMYLPNPELHGNEVVEVSYTYLKLLAVAVGAVLGKRLSPYSRLRT